MKEPCGYGAGYGGERAVFPHSFGQRYRLRIDAQRLGQAGIEQGACVGYLSGQGHDGHAALPCACENASDSLSHRRLRVDASFACNDERGAVEGFVEMQEVENSVYSRTNRGIDEGQQAACDASGSAGSWNGDDVASGEGHTTIVTYQISHAATQPRDKELIALKHALNAHGLHPDITREYVKGTTSPGYWHSAMAIDVVEDI